MVTLTSRKTSLHPALFISSIECLMSSVPIPFPRCASIVAIEIMCPFLAIPNLFITERPYSVLHITYPTTSPPSSATMNVPGNSLRTS